jgi:ribosomal RNA assembly protein
MTEYVKVPKARLGVLIGKDGSVKREIEKRLSLQIDIDKENDTAIIEQKDSEDPLAPWRGRDIVKAIARGFSPDKAFLLFDEDLVFEILDIEDFIGKSENAMLRVRARLIGKNGKTRRIIEEMTEAKVAIYGRTVSFIGAFEEVSNAKHACEMLLHGDEHTTVYRYLEKLRKKKKKERLSLWK